jgi:hypothetical protein
VYLEDPNSEKTWGISRAKAGKIGWLGWIRCVSFMVKNEDFDRFLVVKLG